MFIKIIYRWYKTIISRVELFVVKHVFSFMLFWGKFLGNRVIYHKRTSDYDNPDEDDATS
jgi:hypothetical protein